jgi:flagellar hook-length control protein FliK
MFSLKSAFYSTLNLFIVPPSVRPSASKLQSHPWPKKLTAESTPTSSSSKVFSVLLHFRLKSHRHELLSRVASRIPPTDLPSTSLIANTIASAVTLVDHVESEKQATDDAVKTVMEISHQQPSTAFNLDPKQITSARLHDAEGQAIVCTEVEFQEVSAPPNLQHAVAASQPLPYTTSPLLTAITCPLSPSTASDSSRSSIASMPRSNSTSNSSVDPLDHACSIASPRGKADVDDSPSGT